MRVGVTSLRTPGGIGGPEGGRTLNLCLAKAALFQLSYWPLFATLTAEVNRRSLLPNPLEITLELGRRLQDSNRVVLPRQSLLVPGRVDFTMTIFAEIGDRTKPLILMLPGLRDEVVSGRLNFPVTELADHLAPRQQNPKNTYMIAPAIATITIASTRQPKIFFISIHRLRIPARLIEKPRLLESRLQFFKEYRVPSVQYDIYRFVVPISDELDS